MTFQSSALKLCIGKLLVIGPNGRVISSRRFPQAKARLLPKDRLVSPGQRVRIFPAGSPGQPGFRFRTTLTGRHTLKYWMATSVAPQDAKEHHQPEPAPVPAEIYHLSITSDGLVDASHCGPRVYSPLGSREGTRFKGNKLLERNLGQHKPHAVIIKDRHKH